MSETQKGEEVSKQPVSKPATTAKELIAEIDKEEVEVKREVRELFKQYYAIAKELGSKSVSINLETNTMTMSVD